MATMSILFIVKILFISITTISCDACIDNAQDFINSTQLMDNTIANEILTVDYEINDMLWKIHEFLAMCWFETMPNLPTRSLCDKACSVHATCGAYRFINDASSWPGCELCVTETNGMATSGWFPWHDDVMIGLWAFEQYLSGNL